MHVQHSYAEFILGTYKAQLVDCAEQYPELTKEFNRDYQRLSSAIESHGVRFALDVMPQFRKHLDQCLAKQRLTPTHLIHFGVGKGGTVPRLFRGLILRVFDRSGVLKANADKDAVRLLRQLLGAVRKLRMACSPKDSGNAVQEFIAIDSSVRTPSLSWDSVPDFHDESETNTSSFVDLCESTTYQGELPFPEEELHSTLNYQLLQCVQHVADYICSKLGQFDPLEWKPKHGPGAVSDQRFGVNKYAFNSWTDRLESSFPYADFAVANYGVAAQRLLVEGSSLDAREHPAKLLAVPKTIVTPRLIASEPTSSQWCQQIVRDFFYHRVHHSSLGNFIDFRRQELNGELALKASHAASHSTIDLSSASDRISCWHVERLFRRSPSLLRSLQATRSAWIEQEICRFSPRYHYLRKYSTMGNATTFPVQSLFFLALALGSVLYVRNQKVSDRVIRTMGKAEVRVFGDDIIVPGDCSDVLVELLEALSLKVNIHKTFTKGNFRESCGVDAFSGHDVTTVGILDVPRRTSPGSIVSSVDVHNNLCDRGFLHTAAYIRKTASRLISNKIRAVEHGSGLFGWSSLYGFETPHLRVRHNRVLQRGEIYCLRTRVLEQRSEPKDSSGLLQYFTEAPRVVTSAISTLGHALRRPKVSLTLGWVPTK